MNIIPDNYRYVKDEEIIKEGDIAFGEIEDKNGNNYIGWGNVPFWLIDESYCEGKSNHPVFIVRKIND